MPRLIFFMALLSLPALYAAENDATRLFAEKLRQVLETSCVKCHCPEKDKGGLNMVTREALLKGGQTGPAVLPGNAKGSLLFRMVSHLEEPYMPQKEAKFPAETLAAIAVWIDGGAPYDKPLKVPTTKSNPKDHWSFRPLATGSLQDIDSFILTAQQAKGLSPAPKADRRTLARRVYFDLLGLPPKPEEIAAFVNDPAPDAYEKLVDRLMASPHFGERWARHWLDVARYADSDGYEADSDRPNAYHYRDFVIRAMNDDLPFDTFVKWNVAGDELAPDDPRALAASGFCTAGVVVNSKNGTPLEREKYRYDELDDVISTTGTAFLGLTIGCARCHDHKYDPISAREYYRMIATFANSARDDVFLASRTDITTFRKRDSEFNARLKQSKDALSRWLDEQKKPLVDSLRAEKIVALKISDAEKDLLKQPNDAKNKAQQDLLKKHEKALTPKDDEFRARFDATQRQRWDELSAAVAAIESAKPPAPLQALALSETQSAPITSYLLERGEPGHKAGEVSFGFLAVLNGGSPVVQRPADAKSTFQRAALGAWLTDVEHGAGALVARVIVNRLWQHHFGEGLVRTPNDFGFQGERPTHPELLDWLSGQLVSNGWKLKPLHRAILLSATYQQSGTFDAAKAKIDPENRLLWRRRPLRLEAESLRDAILVASGSLKSELYGPAIKTPLPAEATAGRNKDDKVKRPTAESSDQWRRSIYLFTKRSLPMPLLETFDTPSSGLSCGRRTQSTVAPQALALLNDPFVKKQAELFATRVTAGGAAHDAVIQRAYDLAFGRAPREFEMQSARAFLARNPDSSGVARFCQVLLGLNEFVYVD